MKTRQPTRHQVEAGLIKRAEERIATAPRDSLEIELLYAILIRVSDRTNAEPWVGGKYPKVGG